VARFNLDDWPPRPAGLTESDLIWGYRGLRPKPERSIASAETVRRDLAAAADEVLAAYELADEAPRERKVILEVITA